MNSKSVNSFMTAVAIIYLLCKSMDWFLYDRDLRHERDIAHQNLPASVFFACNFHEAKLRKA